MYARTRCREPRSLELTLIFYLFQDLQNQPYHSIFTCQANQLMHSDFFSQHLINLVGEEVKDSEGIFSSPELLILPHNWFYEGFNGYLIGFYAKVFFKELVGLRMHLIEIRIRIIFIQVSRYDPGSYDPRLFLELGFRQNSALALPVCGDVSLKSFPDSFFKGDLKRWARQPLLNPALRGRRMLSINSRDVRLVGGSGWFMKHLNKIIGMAVKIYI